MRWNLVEDLLVSGLSPGRVVSTTMKHYGCSKWTAERYIESVRKRWEADAELARPSVVHERLARMRMMASKCERKEAWGACSRYDQMINDILGVKAPERLDIRAAVAVGVAPEITAPVDYEKIIESLSEEQIAQLIEISNKLMSAPIDMREDVVARQDEQDPSQAAQAAPQALLDAPIDADTP